MRSQGNDMIARDPDILGGAPVFRGTRVPFQALSGRRMVRILPRSVLSHGTGSRSVPQSQTLRRVIDLHRKFFVE
jgi:hypothetical protein